MRTTRTESAHQKREREMAGGLKTASRGDKSVSILNNIGVVEVAHQHYGKPDLIGTSKYK